ncbi:MAG: ABC transporter permease [Candidatus Latescibacteria bacterium]|nr:ABC transporter permease [Candidatus Latescibacterota bacterium]
MTNALHLYGQYIALSIRGQMQYRASFIMMSIAYFIGTGIEFVGIWGLFDRFAQLRSWTLAEVALFYGMVTMSMALTKTVSYGYDRFEDMVTSGDFDRLLLRPRSTALQLLSQRLQIARIGSIGQSFCVLAWACLELNVAWSPARLALLVAAIIGGSCIFKGLFILRATLCFWTTQGLDVTSALSYGGVETARYPLNIYRAWFRRFFTYIVPLAFISYYPALAILGRNDPLGSGRLLQWSAPLAGFAFLAISLMVWGWGVRHYRSTGS